MMTGLDRIIENALAEDIHTGDITTLSIIKDRHEIRARLIAKEPMVLAGIGAAARVYHLLDQRVLFTPLFKDGDEIGSGETIAELLGDASVLLQGERVALNILQRMCGVATLTARYVAQVRGTAARIVDTRKTAPGLRSLDKYAVRAGGGFNHRFGLYDGVLIKENHITAAGGITVAVARARENIPHLMKIEVETETMAQVAEALACGADIIMLDNMDTAAMREAVEMIAGRALVEASGGVNLETVRAIAETGVNIISVGALTHSCRAMDISMLLEVC
jgi:nicotinate-nucleotide pyrophosphorylase (carboxylating)